MNSLANSWVVFSNRWDDQSSNWERADECKPFLGTTQIYTNYKTREIQEVLIFVYFSHGDIKNPDLICEFLRPLNYQHDQNIAEKPVVHNTPSVVGLIVHTFLAR